MEPLPVPAGPSNDEVHLLRGPSNFLEGGYNTDTTYSSVISVRDICFTVELKRRDSATVVNFDITCLDWEIALRFYDKFKGRGCECGSQGASATNLLLSRVPRRPRRSSSVADLEELFDVFVPGISGHQVNTHLDTLKLFPASASEAECFIKELCRMLKLNTTLKHVEVVPVGWIKSWTIGEDYRYWKGPLDVELDLRRILELIMRYELRLNTSLQSLVLGYWNVLRVGGRWQKSYQHGGPCLKVQSTDQYDVKVKMRH